MKRVEVHVAKLVLKGFRGDRHGFAARFRQELTRRLADPKRSPESARQIRAAASKAIAEARRR